jgi:hypothetical protein
LEPISSVIAVLMLRVFLRNRIFCIYEMWQNVDKVLCSQQAVLTVIHLLTFVNILP